VIKTIGIWAGGGHKAALKALKTFDVGRILKSEKTPVEKAYLVCMLSASGNKRARREAIQMDAAPFLDMYEAGGAKGNATAYDVLQRLAFQGNEDALAFFINRFEANHKWLSAICDFTYRGTEEVNARMSDYLRSFNFTGHLPQFENDASSVFKLIFLSGRGFSNIKQIIKKLDFSNFVEEFVRKGDTIVMFRLAEAGCEMAIRKLGDIDVSGIEKRIKSGRGSFEDLERLAIEYKNEKAVDALARMAGDELDAAYALAIVAKEGNVRAWTKLSSLAGSHSTALTALHELAETGDVRAKELLENMDIAAFIRQLQSKRRKREGSIDIELADPMLVQAILNLATVYKNLHAIAAVKTFDLSGLAFGAMKHHQAVRGLWDVAEAGSEDAMRELAELDASAYIKALDERVEEFVSRDHVESVVALSHAASRGNDVAGRALAEIDLTNYRNAENDHYAVVALDAVAAYNSEAREILEGLNIDRYIHLLQTSAYSRNKSILDIVAAYENAEAKEASDWFDVDNLKREALAGNHIAIYSLYNIAGTGYEAAKDILNETEFSRITQQAAAGDNYSLWALLALARVRTREKGNALQWSRFMIENKSAWDAVVSIDAVEFARQAETGDPVSALTLMELFWAKNKNAGAAIEGIDVTKIVELAKDDDWYINILWEFAEAGNENALAAIVELAGTDLAAANALNYLVAFEVGNSVDAVRAIDIGWCASSASYDTRAVNILSILAGNGHEGAAELLKNLDVAKYRKRARDEAVVVQVLWSAAGCGNGQAGTILRNFDNVEGYVKQAEAGDAEAVLALDAIADYKEEAATAMENLDAKVFIDRHVENRIGESRYILFVLGRRKNKPAWKEFHEL